MPSLCHSWMVSSGTLSSAATSSVVEGASDSAPAASPDSGASTGAIAIGGQSGLGHDHSVLPLLHPPLTDRRGLSAPLRCGFITHVMSLQRVDARAARS